MTRTPEEVARSLRELGIVVEHEQVPDVAHALRQWAFEIIGDCAQRIADVRTEMKYEECG